MNNGKMYISFQADPVALANIAAHEATSTRWPPWSSAWNALFCGFALERNPKAANDPRYNGGPVFWRIHRVVKVQRVSDGWKRDPAPSLGRIRPARHAPTIGHSADVMLLLYGTLRLIESNRLAISHKQGDTAFVKFRHTDV